MTVRTALSQGAKLLGSKFTAELLLAHAMRCERVYFYAHPEQELREVEWLHYGRYLHERLKGKPTQHITKKQEFYGREFRVGPEALIPRPETEILVETVLKLRPDARRVVDVGTGTGAIAITLALELNRRIFATDISPDALSLASRNASTLHADVSFIEADLVCPFADSTLDVVVSNPPYIALADRETLQPEVRDWEPALALFAGRNGMAVYERLIPEAWRALRPGGLLALELGFGQADAVSALTHGWRDLQVLPDLAGIPRILTCSKG